MLIIPYNKMHFQTCFQNQIRSKSNLMKRVVGSLKFHFAIWQTLKKKRSLIIFSDKIKYFDFDRTK